MANSFPSPIVLPDPVTLGTGRILTGGATSTRRLGEVANYLLGNMSRGTVGQAWPDSHFQQTGTAMQEALVYKLAIPPGCTTATVRVYAGSSTSTGVVRVVSTEGADTLDLSIDSVADVYRSGTLDVAPDADGVETVTVSLKGGDSAPDIITLSSLGIMPDPLASPLAGALIGDGIPLGVDRFDADSAAPAWLYQALVDDLATVRDDYPRTVAIWSAGNASLTGGQIIHRLMLQLFRWLGYGRLGPDPDPEAEVVTVHARLTEQAGATSVNIATAPGDMAPRHAMQGAGTATASAGAGAATAWKQGTARVRHVIPGGGGGNGYETLVIETDPRQGGAVVRSLTVVA